MPARRSGGPVDRALAFPGQGGSWSDALDVLARTPPGPLVAALSDHLGTDRWPDLDPNDTRCVQPVIYVAGLIGPAATAADDDVCCTLGHSLGEITAAAWAGALDDVAGLELVVHRAELGHAAQLRRPGAMAASMRWARARVDDLIASLTADASGTLEVAVINGPTQLVLTGDRSLVDAAVTAINEAGGVARELPIAGAYHSSLMASAVEDFRRQVTSARLTTPRVPVVSSTAPQAHVTTDTLGEQLVASLAAPVDWPAAITVARSVGARRGTDAGPGDTIERLARYVPELPFAAA